jgi:EAL domain-containing protein (putative c-di-GMP-specific phosphodiesterase class I)
MQQPQDRRGLLAQDLEGAVERGEIVAVFQPQFSLTTGLIESAEALSRWQHPYLGLVSPAEFIPVAEQTGVISQIGDHMIRLACRTVTGWTESGLSIEVAVNVSLLQLRDSGFAARFKQLVGENSASARLITVEITESIAAVDVPSAEENLRSLAALGATISIDDFGSGFSTEEQVAAFPTSELKIDRTLVQDQSDAGFARLADAVSFGKRRRMRIVAEGVETGAQLDWVRELGCDRAQGYLLARPLPKRELDARLGRID